MVNVSSRLRLTCVTHPDYSILDLKADCRGDNMWRRRSKCFRKNLSPFLLAKIRHEVACLGRIHALNPLQLFVIWRRY